MKRVCLFLCHAVGWKRPKDEEEAIEATECQNEFGLATYLQFKIATEHVNANGTGYSGRFELFVKRLHPFVYV